MWVQAAVQAVAPSGIFFGLGLLLLFTLLHPGLAADANANAMLQSMAGFLAWWAGLSWFSYCVLELWLFRTGTFQN